MDKTGMTYAEYCDILENEMKVLSEKKQTLDSKNEVFSRCCNLKNDVVYLGFEKMKMLLNDENGKNKFKEALKCIFGHDFFEDMTKEQKEEYNKKGFFTKYNLDEILGMIYGSNYGHEFKRPSSWDEMILFLNNVFEVFNNNLINSALKEPYHRILFSFNRLIEASYANSIAEMREINFILNMYNEFLSAFDKKRMVNIDEKTYPLIKNALNKDSRKFITLENDEEKKIGFGDAFIMFCELYNSEFKKAQENVLKNKEQLKVQEQIDKYYKRIKNILFDKLENKNFPKYTNENYVQIIKGVIDNFEKDLNSDERWLPYYTVSLMHYASYFKTKYYDEEKVFGKKEDLKASK